MSSPGEGLAEVAVLGLLSPVVAGTTGERLTSDRSVVAAMVRAEASLVRALVRAGVAPVSAEPAAAAIADAEVDVRDLAERAVEGGNPVIPLVKVLRAAAAEESAGWVHYGATSQDILDTALMLVAGDVVRRIEAGLTRLAATLARMADEHRSLPMVARTLTQQAMPTTLGMRIAGWLAGVHDAVRSVRSCVPLPVSLGGAVGTNAAYGEHGPAVVEAFAAELDLAAPVSPWHTRRTPVIDLAGALTLAGESCGKIAADVLVTAQTEIGEVREGTGGASSVMAHKANPTQSMLVVAAARELPPLASIVSAAGAPEQERPAGAWHSEWQPLRTMLRLSAGAAERTAGLVEGLRFDPDAIARNLDHLLAALGEDPGWVVAQTEHVGLWIDRVLAQHSEVFR